MPLLSRKGILAIAAVIDVAINSDVRPVSAKALASRHGLPPRHLEPVLQALVHEGILRGVRGPRGGYELGRDQAEITANEILRAAVTVDDTFGGPPQGFAGGHSGDPGARPGRTRLCGHSRRHQLDDLIKRAEKAKLA